MDRLISLVVLPLMTVMSFFTGIGGIIGGIILAFNGDWRILLYGILLSIGGTFILMLPILGVGLFAGPGVALQDSGKKVIGGFLIFLGIVYLSIVFGIWSIWILFAVLAQATSLWGGLLFAYGVAMGPIVYMGSRSGAVTAEEIISNSLSIFSVQIALAVSVIYLIFVVYVNFIDLLIVYSITAVVLAIITYLIIHVISEDTSSF